MSATICAAPAGSGTHAIACVFACVRGVLCVLCASFSRRATRDGDHDDDDDDREIARARVRVARANVVVVERRSIDG